MAQQLTHGASSESKWVRYRYVRQHCRDLFPYIPPQSGYHKRIRAAFEFIQHTIVALTQETET